MQSRTAAAATDTPGAGRRMLRRAKLRGPAPGRTLVLLGIVLAALTLRTAVTAITPLLDRIGTDIGFGSTVDGVIGMLPTAMFALFGIITPALVVRFGLEWVALAAVFLAGAGMLARAFVGTTWGLILLSALALGGMGIGNVVLPPLVKRYFSDRVALLSAVYITCVQLGTAIPPLVAVPLAQSSGWRVSLGVWALVGFAAVLPWAGVIARRRVGTRGQASAPEPRRAQIEDTPAPPVDRAGPVWRTALGWGMAAMFGMTSLITYSMFTWLPQILTDAGYSAQFGGTMVALFAAMGFVSALGAPSVCSRMDNPFPLVVGCVAAYLAGFGGLYFAAGTVPALWVVLAGLGPSTFPMSLTLINLRTESHVGSSRLSGFTQGVGYTAACAGPLLFGLLHDATGGWGWPFLLLLAAVVVMTAGAFQACRPQLLEDAWAARRAPR